MFWQDPSHNVQHSYTNTSSNLTKFIYHKINHSCRYIYYIYESHGSYEIRALFVPFPFSSPCKGTKFLIPDRYRSIQSQNFTWHGRRRAWPKSAIVSREKKGLITWRIILVTPPKFSSSPLKNDGWKITFLLGWPIFRGYVSFR